MNLLVTNARTAQAYVIIRCLRPHARKIVAETYGHSALAARISPAANSRLVDRVCRLPYPARDWLAGRLQPTNTEAEERYLEALLEVCAREQIDTIFPSLDAQVYILSKNRARLQARGVFAPVPDYETLLGSLDKYRTIQAAAAAGFPHPRTLLGEDDAAVAQFGRDVPPPWIVRPRCSAGSLGLELVTDPAQLVPCVQRARAQYGAPMVQEYIAGTGRQNFYLLLDAQGDPVFALCPRVLRCSSRIFRNNSAAVESAADHPLLPRVLELARRLNWRGTLTVQTKIDPRTGQPCLMEANPRLGTHIWYRTELGLNEPLRCLQIARGEPVERGPVPPAGVRLLEPVEDLVGGGFEMLDWLLYQVRIGLLGRAPLDPASPPPSPRQLLRDFAACYRRGVPKRYSPLSNCWRDDPLVTLLWSYTIFRSWTRNLHYLGR